MVWNIAIEKLFMWLEKEHIYVNIFQQHHYCITPYVSTHCNTHCFVLQKSLFCWVKEPILQRKTGTFALRNRYYCFQLLFSLQNKSIFLVKSPLYPLRIRGFIAGAEHTPFPVSKHLFYRIRKMVIRGSTMH